MRWPRRCAPGQRRPRQRSGRGRRSGDGLRRRSCLELLWGVLTQLRRQGPSTMGTFRPAGGASCRIRNRMRLAAGRSRPPHRPMRDPLRAADAPRRSAPRRAYWCLRANGYRLDTARPRGLRLCVRLGHYRADVLAVVFLAAGVVSGAFTSSLARSRARTPLRLLSISEPALLRTAARTPMRFHCRRRSHGRCKPVWFLHLDPKSVSPRTTSPSSCAASR
mmetsp:Transcript_105317/g.296505  ORF Transcript_105317/g.296505 Transcript_105317/m.296505 type:complete len:220 (-) Transcript_105317:341-1000(-)